jgi:hypothetical protein
MKSSHSIVLVLLLALSISNPLFSAERSNEKADRDTQSALRARISLDLNEVSLEEALAVIARKGKLKLNYNRSRIPIHRRVSLTKENITAGEALRCVLQDTSVVLKITSGGQLVIVPSQKEGATAVESRTGRISGRVRDGRTGDPIPAVLAALFPRNLTVLTNLSGTFSFEDLIPGTYAVVLSSRGYESLTLPDIKVRAGATEGIDAALEWLPIKAESEAIDVYGRIKARTNPVSAHALTAREIQGFPGTGGVISRLPQTFPGLSFMTDENLDFVVRGGSPLENGFYVDNIEVPSLGHIARSGSQGGFYSSLNPGLIQNLEFLSGCFSPDFGDRLSSITRVTLREGNRERLAGRTDLSLAGMGAELEGPLFGQRGSWIASLRKSYLGSMENMFENMGTMPDTIDSQVKLNLDMSPRHRISFLNFYNRGDFDQADATVWWAARIQQIQNTAGLSLVSHWHPDFLSTTSLSYSASQRSDSESLHLYKPRPDLWSLDERNSSVNLRNLNYLALNPNHKLDFGFQFKTVRESLDHVVSTPITDHSGKVLLNSSLGLRYRSTNFSLFSSYTGNPAESLTLNLGLRSDYYSAQDHFSLSPRISLAVNLSRTLALNAGIGVFRQTLPMNLLAYSPQAVELEPMRATHAILGIDHVSRAGTKWSVEVYAKEYESLPISLDAPRNLLTDLFLDRSLESDGTIIGYWLPSAITAAGTAYSRGIEFMHQKHWSPNFFTLVTASYFRSRYKDLYGVERDRVFDSRYIFNFVAKYRPGSFWELSGALIVRGGGPYTPFDWYRSRQAQRCVLDESNYLNHRYPGYSCLNLRISRAHFLNNRNVFVYLDILNVLNHDNVAGYEWDYGNIVPDASHQLAILPVLGIMYRF